MSGECFRGDVRQMLEMFLATSRRAADAFAEAHERINDKRRARDGHQRQPRIEIEEIRREPDQRQTLAHQIPDRLGDRLLHLVTSLVIRDMSWPLVCRLKERGRLIEDVPEQPVAEVADDALTNVGHHKC